MILPEKGQMYTYLCIGILYDAASDVALSYSSKDMLVVAHVSLS